jgi:hypothetical protein
VMPENPLKPELESNHTVLSTALPLEDILVILDAYHQRQAEKLREIRLGLTELNRDLMAQTTLRLEAFTASNRKEYLTLLTQHIMALLDGGDGPIFPVTMLEKSRESLAH